MCFTFLGIKSIKEAHHSRVPTLLEDSLSFRNLLFCFHSLIRARIAECSNEYHDYFFTSHPVISIFISLLFAQPDQFHRKIDKLDAIFFSIFFSYFSSEKYSEYFFYRILNHKRKYLEKEEKGEISNKWNLWCNITIFNTYVLQRYFTFL